MDLLRAWRHLTTSRRRALRDFPPSTLAAIEQTIRDSEATHSAEIRFVLEPALALPAVLGGVTPLARARGLFATLGVWDTARNNGVLVYLLFADRAIEIVADRGYTGRVDDAQWRGVCAAAEAAFARGEFTAGSLTLLERVGALAALHFPPHPADVDELPDSPTIL